MTERRFPVDGQLDYDNAPDVLRKLLVLVKSTDDDLVVDCSGLEFVDSSGIAVFANVQRVMAIHGRNFRVENLSGMARRTLELCGLLEVMETPQQAPA